MTIYLHIGTEKTGTTTLQSFLSDNRSLLLKRGFCYPQSPGPTNHIDLAIYASSNRAKKLAYRRGVDLHDDLGAYREQFKARFLHEAKTSRWKVLLLSNEHCASRLQTPNEVQRLINLLSLISKDIRVVVYLRRQDDKLLSSYWSKIKAGSTAPLEIPDINPTKLPLAYNYLSLLDRWSNIVGKENVLVRIFETEQLINSDLLSDFASTVGLTSLSGFKSPNLKNESLDSLTTEFLRLLNNHLPSDVPLPRRAGLIKILQEASTGPKPALPGPELDAFMRNFDESNRAVARKYLGRDDDILFRQPRKSSKQHPSPPLDTLKAVELAAHLWHHKTEPSTRYPDKLSSRLRVLQKQAIDVVADRVGELSAKDLKRGKFKQGKIPTNSNLHLVDTNMTLEANQTIPKRFSRWAKKLGLAEPVSEKFINTMSTRAISLKAIKESAGESKLNDDQKAKIKEIKQATRQELNALLTKEQQADLQKLQKNKKANKTNP